MENSPTQNRDSISVEQKEDSSSKEKKTNVNLDTILIEELGQFGTYQIRALAVCLIVSLFSGSSNIEYVFTAARIETRCLIPECEQNPPQWSSPWVDAAIPPAAIGPGLDNCQRFAATNNTASDTCSTEQFDQSERISCEEYLYENTNTVVYDFNLACDEWRRTIIGSIRTFGTLLVLSIAGAIADKWGRRSVLCICGINSAWIGILRILANTYPGFLISVFAESFFASGTLTTAYIMAAETVGPEYRVIAGTIVNSFYSFGQITVAFMSWLIPDWRNLTIAIYAPQFISILYYFLINESVRWYISKGRFEEAESTLKLMANVNRKQLSDKSLTALRESAEETNLKTTFLKEQAAMEPWLPVIVFRNKPILIRCFVLSMSWMSTILIFYGTSINAVNLSGNSHFNFMAAIATEIIGYWVGVFLMNKIGRKSLLIGACWICAACQIGFIFIPENLGGVSLALFLLGKLSIAAASSTLYAFTAELFPTQYRNSLFAFCSMVGRIGSIVAPLTPALSETVWVPLPSVLFAGFALLSGALVFMVPETLGIRLPDTMEDACNIGKDKNEDKQILQYNQQEGAPL